jgi:DNA repair photolyase
MKRWGEQRPVRIEPRELKTDLGKGNFIFIGSSCDLFAQDIEKGWIMDTLLLANKYENQYLIQSKNPLRFHEFLDYIPADKYTLCTTVETNRQYPEIMNYSPAIPERVAAMMRLPLKYRRMVTIEPILDFDLEEMIKYIWFCNPHQVNIGADSGKNHLPEPPAWKIRELIEQLSRYTTVLKKPNLKRLLEAV